ncbi:hypothetical protein A3K55_02120 [Candidatus Shapirobacteria bacterium RBG_13_44_7]|uniref:Uncharacterized protein n=1 Tax=Candidatus Shapirobacteria bacterium RBG_13_44_7 TaxID=1802149 RepID=A0A1F7SGM6_9BACT|nr:MAG: hypothetical protein A3K55_02120 [Candidatus Shapirobacteria bacterium RBG_13_44_7]
MVSLDQVSAFLQIAASVFLDTSLTQPILQRYPISSSSFPQIKTSYLEYARKSVPPGHRGKFEKDLRQLLS